MDAKEIRSKGHNVTHVYTVRRMQHVKRSWCYKEQQPLNPTPWSFFTATRTPYHHQHSNVKTPSPTLRCHHHTKISQRNYITSPAFLLNTYSCPLHTWTQNISGTITLVRQTISIYASVNRTWSIRLYQCVPTLQTLHNINTKKK
jgi:hypothetical protein